jgi:hypothetical protein
VGEYVIQQALDNPFAFSASVDPDTMNLHEARRQPDWPQFQLAMRDDVKVHENRNHWKLIRRSAIPHRVSVLPSVWPMKRKRRIATREIYKWKARLTVHGEKSPWRELLGNLRTRCELDVHLTLFDLGSTQRRPHSTNRFCLSQSTGQY